MTKSLNFSKSVKSDFLAADGEVIKLFKKV